MGGGLVVVVSVVLVVLVGVLVGGSVQVVVVQVVVVSVVLVVVGGLVGGLVQVVVVSVVLVVVVLVVVVSVVLVFVVLVVVVSVVLVVVVLVVVVSVVLVVVAVSVEDVVGIIVVVRWWSQDPEGAAIQTSPVCQCNSPLMSSPKLPCFPSGCATANLFVETIVNVSTTLPLNTSWWSLIKKEYPGSRVGVQHPLMSPGSSQYFSSESSPQSQTWSQRLLT